MKCLVCFFIILFFYAKCSCETKNSYTSAYVQKQISTIPDEERTLLEHFFQKLVKTEGLGYVLFGTKPVCLTGYFLKMPLGNQLSRTDCFLIKKGWMVWKKYEHLFPHPNFIIFEENKLRDDPNLHPIFFISKKNCLDVVAKNKTFFEKKLKTTFGTEEFLKQIEVKQSLYDLINFHEGLLGILLGYGFESSMQYCYRDMVWNSKVPVPYKEIVLHCISNDSFSEHFSVYPMQFVGNPESQEVKTIVDQNLKERALIHSLYSEGNFLEITLKKLME